MNLLLAPMMEAPSWTTPGRCLCCGQGPTEQHHPVRRSQGGTSGPTVTLCRDWHNDAHAMRLHLRYRGGWEWLRTEPMKYQAALDQPGWQSSR